MNISEFYFNKNYEGEWDMKFFKKLFDHEYKELTKFKKIADEVMALDGEYSKLSDQKL